jgi:hypothetical protein
MPSSSRSHPFQCQRENEILPLQIRRGSLHGVEYLFTMSTECAKSAKYAECETTTIYCRSDLGSVKLSVRAAVNSYTCWDWPGVNSLSELDVQRA